MNLTVDEIVTACAIQKPITPARYDLWALFRLAREGGVLQVGEPNPANPAEMAYPWGAAYTYMRNVNAAAIAAWDQDAYQRWLARGNRGSFEDYLAEQIRVEHEINGIDDSLKTLGQVRKDTVSHQN